MSEVQIECPKCKEHFIVGPELRGRKVECGGCKHHFDVTDDTFVKGTLRYYPGEKNQDLSGFSKRTPEMQQDAQVDFRTAAYEKQVDPNALMPLGARRLICIFAGVSLILLVIAGFYFGNSETGGMSDVSNDKRWILAIFAAVVGSLLISFGFRKRRIVGILLALILGAAVCYMPVLYPKPEKPAPEPLNPSEMDLSLETGSMSEDIMEYKQNLGYATVQTKILEVGDPSKVVVMALKKAKPEHIDIIKEYLGRSLNTQEIPHIYAGRKIDGVPTTLLIYMQGHQNIEQFTETAAAFGKVSKVRADLRVIEIDINTAALITTSSSMLTDESDAGFFRANLDELSHIDLKRQQEALLRLAKVKKLGLRADIVARLLDLLKQPNYPYKQEVVTTLISWVIPDDNADQVVIQEARVLIAKKARIPSSYQNYLVSLNVHQIDDILLYIWRRNPSLNESLLVDSGERGESALLSALDSMTNDELRSAASVLRKVGSKDSIPALQKAHDKAQGEIQKSLKAAIDEINSRG